jgi:hypothetical protein
LPEVCFLCVLNFRVSHHLSAISWHVSMILLTYFFAGSSISCFTPSPSRGGASSS